MNIWDYNQKKKPEDIQRCQGSDEAVAVDSIVSVVALLKLSDLVRVDDVESMLEANFDWSDQNFST